MSTKSKQQATEATVQLWEEVHRNRTDYSLQCKRCLKTIWQGRGQIRSREAWEAVRAHAC